MENQVAPRNDEKLPAVETGTHATAAREQDVSINPTRTQYDALQVAYDRINHGLFAGTLHHVVFTMQRHPSFAGYYSPNRMASRTDPERTSSEIAINPDAIAAMPDYLVLRIIAHEMVHAWQFQFGKPGRRGYHNAEFADKMEAIGMVASSTGRPGGKRTGERMSEYVVPNGPFDQLAKEMLAEGWHLAWDDAAARSNLARLSPPFDIPGMKVHLVVNERGEPKLVLGAPDTTPPPPPADIGDDPKEDVPMEHVPKEARHLLADDATPEQDVLTVFINNTPVRMRRNIDRPPKKVYRHKYCCPICSMAVWGKPGLQVKCAEHDLLLTAAAT